MFFDSLKEQADKLNILGNQDDNSLGKKGAPVVGAMNLKKAKKG